MYIYTYSGFESYLLALTRVLKMQEFESEGEFFEIAVLLNKL